MIPDEIIEQIREAADIVGIIGEYVPLKKTGSDFRGPCPFHQGKNRNFSVVPAKRLYHCFVCGETGDVFKFLQKRLGIGWPEAVKAVGEKTGIDVPDTRVRREGPDPREPMWEVQGVAAGFFEKMLWEDDSGEQAREYLAERNVSRDVASQFGIGYAPREIDAIRSYMRTLGFDDERMIAGGLLILGENEVEPRPRFRNRLMFPIFDVQGRGVGFGGRVLGPGEPKYLNSPESPIFSKGRMLYGLNRSRNAIRRADRVLVVEGYFDALRLIASGIEEVVAPLGTALTEAQAGILRRYTRNVYLLYDSDAAGLKATFRAGDELLRQGFSVRVVTLPPGDDPDSYTLRHGSKGMESQLAQAIDVFERKVQILDRAGWFAELQKKRRALDRLLPTIRATSDEIMRDLYIGRASEITGVDRGVLVRELGHTRLGTPAGMEMAPPQPTIGGRPRDRRERRRPASSAERELVRAMVNQRWRVESIAERVGPEAFRDADYRAIFAALLDAGEHASLADLAVTLDSEALEIAEGLMQPEDQAYDFQATVEHSLAKLTAREIEERLADIDKLMAVASENEKDELMREKQRLVRDAPDARSLRMKQYRGQSR